MLYNNVKNPEKIESALVADIIGEKVTINLFGEGNNRGKDGLQIHKALTTAITEFSNINKLSPREILESPEFDKIISEITNEINANTKYTTAGLATSGIYLPDNAITPAMIQGFTEKVNIAAGDYKLTSPELSSTQVLATSIASNLFGKEAETTHVADIAQIEKLLIKTLHEIKADHPDLNLESALVTNKELLVGSLDRGYLSTTGKGITKLFYDQCNYSGTALSAGIKSSQFQTNLKEQISESIQENIAHSKVKPIEKISSKDISKNMIPPSAKSAAKNIGTALSSPNTNTPRTSMPKIV